MTSRGYRPHAQAAGYGLRWLIGTRREEIAISTLMRAEIARRFCRCLQATYGRSQLRERAFRPLEIPLVPGSSSSAHGGANGGRARVTSRRAPRRALQKRVQSRAYAPPQGPPTRSPPITQDTTITVAAAHTLTRVGGPKPPRHGPSLHTAKTGNEAHHCGQSRPLIFSTHLARRPPARWRSGSAQHTRQHARTSS